MTVGRWLGDLCRKLAETDHVFVGLDWSSGRPEPVILDRMGMSVEWSDEMTDYVGPVAPEPGPEPEEEPPGPS